MLISIITLFPQMFQNIFDVSIPKRAIGEGIIKLEYINLRDFGIGKHKIVDDKPYGGGVGMIFRVDVIDRAITYARRPGLRGKVILLDPQGEKYSQKYAEGLASFPHLILVCGHYEGVDERIRRLVDIEVSIGDYVLSGGEIPAMVIVDSVIRLVPGVLKKEDAAQVESFSRIGGRRILEYPQFTRPRVYQNMRVPKILLSGNQKLIENYRMREALKLTKKRRPDMLKQDGG